MNWIDSYYEAVEFFYWEPQHIGRRKYASSALNSIEKVLERVRSIEVTLNHNLHQFFLLAPSSLASELFALKFACQDFGTLNIHGRKTAEEFKLGGAIQPDFLFTSDTDVAAVEMKINAKCSPTQVAKYAFLGLAAEVLYSKELRHRLLLLGKGQFSNLWREGFTSVSEVRAAALNAIDAQFLKKLPDPLRQPERLCSILERMDIAHITYDELSTFLRASIPKSQHLSNAEEVYRNLLLGVVTELSSRGLTNDAQQAAPADSPQPASPSAVCR